MTAGDDCWRGGVKPTDQGSPLPREYWRRMRGWYREVVDHAPPPAKIKLDQIMAELKEIYRAVPPQGGIIPTSMLPSQIYDSVPA